MQPHYYFVFMIIFYYFYSLSRMLLCKNKVSVFYSEEMETEVKLGCSS